MHSNNDIDKLKNLGKSTSTFYFKQFKVEDDRSTMKVGADAVLLGAVVHAEDAEKILEIGTGCGVISLILAQRSKARIDAIEIDEESVKQALGNVISSPWKNRIKIIHSTLQDYSNHTSEKYDLVISNPPYFSRSLKSDDWKRNLSRHNESLTIQELVKGVNDILADKGSFWLILPVNESIDFMDEATKAGLYLHYAMKIIPKAGKPYHRVIMQFRNIWINEVKEEMLVIKSEDGSYTGVYKNITRDFYLDF
jgi:tRNA1Val (adenine37-N6)-methyltransferase